jgi:two-component system response regulator CpxR
MPIQNAKILLVDNDIEICKLLTSYLTKEGYQVVVAQTGEEGIDKLFIAKYDLVLLDIVLPKIDGFEVLKRIRQSHLTPVILLTSNDEEFERVYGFELGADDCISRLISARELLARIKARLRRESYVAGNGLQSLLVAGNLTVNTCLRTANFKNVKLDLTDAEFDIIELLVKKQGQVVSKIDISEQVFRRPLQDFDRSIDMHFSNLRKKLCNLQATDLIRTIRSRGYMLVRQWT